MKNVASAQGNGSKKSRFCLLMIVRDEEKVITRALESVKEFLMNGGTYVICDTGSVDNTMEVIDNWMTEHSVEGYLITKEWVNFGYNKDYLIKQAQEGGLAGGAEYLFWLDADEVFVSHDYNGDVEKYPTASDVNMLRALCDMNPHIGVFYFITHYGPLRYPRWNVVRNNKPYKWIYPAHEQLIAPPGTGSYIYPNIVLIARKEGKNSQDPEHNNKYIKWFEEYLKEEPTNQHCQFYLGQSYQDGGRLEEAIVEYMKYVKLPDAHESYKYIAYTRSGRIAIALKRFEDAEIYLKAAFEVFPDRIEAQYYLLLVHTHNKNYKDGLPYIDIKNCGKTPNPSHLFIEDDIYKWKYNMQASYVAHMAKEPILAYNLGKLFVESESTPEKIRNGIAKSNLDQFEKIVKAIENPFVAKMPQIVHPHTIIIDNFFPDPDAIREFALKQNFETVSAGLSRTVETSDNNYLRLFSVVTQRKVKQDTFSHMFELIQANHRDILGCDSHTYTAVVYLTPSAPVNTGITFYRHINTGIVYNMEHPDMADVLKDDLDNPDKWEKLNEIKNVYNRCVIYDGRRCHSSTAFSGIDNNSATLRLVFRMDCE